ncbi:MAG TPA: VanZ family protein [Coriobacteriia bacterium]|jgi:VanZ family protein
MERGSTARLALLWAPSAIWMGVIFGFSSLTGSELSPVAGFSPFGHLGEYAVLGVLLLFAARRTWGTRVDAVFAVAVSSAYGVTDELHQFLTPGRTPDPADWAADTVGAAVAVGCVILVGWLLKRRKGLSDA